MAVSSLAPATLFKQSPDATYSALDTGAWTDATGQTGPAREAAPRAPEEEHRRGTCPRPPSRVPTGAHRAVLQSRPAPTR